MTNQTITHLGIDISKHTIDIGVKIKENYSHFCINNKEAELIDFFSKYVGKPVVIAMENTGKYNWCLQEVLQGLGLEFYVLNPLHLYKSMGLVRGKTDKIDAFRIADYIERNRDLHEPYKIPQKAVSQLKVLLNERDNLVKQKAKLKAQDKDLALLKIIDLEKSLKKMHAQQIKFLDQQIHKIENMINALIQSDNSLSNNYKLLCSIPGIGQVVAWYLLAKTENFTKIITARKLACFAGVAPFSKQSGLFKGRDKLSKFADKQLKKLLHLAALSTIRLENDLAHYYHRKVAEGKNKMSVLNAVRNKIIHIAYAVIKNQKMFENRLQVS